MKAPKRKTIQVRGVDPDIWSKFKELANRKGRITGPYLTEILKREIDKEKDD